jgi:hypothetical protein
MSKLNVSVPHGLGREEATNRVKAFIAQAKEQFGDKMSGFKEEWAGNDCEFTASGSGVSVSGQLKVSEDKVEITSKLPMAAMFFKGKLETALTDGLTAILKK